MDPISLIVLVLVIGGVSALLDRKLQARRKAEGNSALESGEEAPAKSFIDQTSSQAQALGSQAMDWAKSFGSQASSHTQALGSQAAEQAQSLRERIPFGQPKLPLAPDFRAWASEATKEEPVLQSWLASLRDEQFVDFTLNVEDFCTSIGFELEWLVHGEFNRMPQLADNAGQAVVNYCRSCQQAAAAQAALEPFRIYRDYTQNPGSQRGRAYGEALLDHLLKDGLTSVSLSDFLSASPKDKQGQVLQAIQAAADKDKDQSAFNRVLMSMNAGDEQALGTRIK
jgi:hypothetical protein